MPKSLVLGNGNILVGLNKFGQVKDFYFPYVGLENHVGGNFVHKIGVFVEGQFSWLDSGCWNIDIDYKDETLVSEILAQNDQLKVKLTFNDIVYNESNIFLRQVSVENLDDRKRQIKVFFHQEFQIYESLRGDTAYFDPVNHVIVHYKGKRVFLINAMVGSKNFDGFSIGISRIEGKEGTYKDAEDGQLSQNPIEHGLVDSVLSFTFDLEAKESWVMHYWIAVAEFLKDAQVLNQYILKKTPQHLMKTTQDFWRAWVNKQPFHLLGLSSDISQLFKKSLFIIRTHVDNHGAVIASSDSDLLEHGRDYYSYMWPRDGALTAIGIDKSGEDNVARRFFQFVNEVITDGGYLMHKYLSDESLGSSWHPWLRDGVAELPIQEDETALVIIALWQHYQLTKDLEFVENIYNSLIKKAADFMVEFRDEKTGLPKPTYDLWEEKFGITTFTCASVCAALLAASGFAQLLGKTDSEQRYKKTAIEIKNAILSHLYDNEEGIFYKMINFQNGQKVVDQTVDTSSIYGIFKFKLLDIEDERLTRAVKITQDRLTVPGAIGGIARYEGDMYWRIAENTPGNPWIITTLWLVQYLIVKAKNESDLEVVKQKLSWVASHSSKAGMLPEQLNPITGEPVSATPLTWSHSEFIRTVIAYLDKLEELGICKQCNPVK